MWRCLLFVLLAAWLAAATSAAAASGAAGRTITVQGTGIVTTIPDEADFTFGVSVTAPTANAALGADGRRMNAVIAAVKSQGVADADIQTAEISLSPNTNQAGTKVVDFTASNSVTVKTRAIAKAGSIVDAAVGAGANTISGPSLTASDQVLLTQRALKAAMADARARAQAIAAAAHVRLGAVRTVTEGSTTPVTFAPAPKASAAAQGTPVQAGTVQTEEDVTVTFGIS
jgi:uncharacterized protein YggE